MPSYKIDLGNSTDGVLGAVIRVNAPTKRHALEIVRQAIRENTGAQGDVDLDLGDDFVEYGVVYFNPDAIFENAFDDADEDEAEEDDQCFVCGEDGEDFVQLTEGAEPDPGTFWQGLVAEALDVVTLCKKCARDHGVAL